MAASPPQGFVDLQTAYRTFNRDLSVVGVVADFLPGAPTRGTDWQMTFTLQDPSLHDSPGLRVKMFQKTEDDLPMVQAQGDIVILHHLKVKEWSGSVTGLSSWLTQCIVLPSASIPDPHYKDTYVGGRQIHHLSTPSKTAAPTLAEQLYAIDLRRWYLENQATFPVPQHAPKAPTSMITASNASKAEPPGRAGAPPVPSAGPSPFKDKFALIRDVSHAQYCDLVGEVLKIHPSTGGGLEIYITDYTENRLLWHYETPEEKAETSGELRDGDAYGYLDQEKKNEWGGPYGRYTLQILLWAPHAYWTQANVRVGDFVFVRNVRIKFNQYTSGVLKLEGVLHEDRQRPHQVDVRTLRSDDRRVERLKERKSIYYAKRERELWKAPGELSDKAQQSSKGRAKRNKRKKQQALPEQSKRALSNEPTVTRNVNEHVRSRNLDIPVMPIKDILDNLYLSDKAPSGVERRLPFINMKCRSCIRVIDFYPHKLEDFAQCLDDPSYNDISSESDKEELPYIDPLASQGPNSWEWAFYLLVEDAKPPPGTEEPARMKLLVAAKDADYLLKLDAANLREDAHTLAQLREKLFILWGELEEHKSADQTLRTENKAFECCIQEYGAPVGDALDSDGTPTEWMRVHSMFGTTIL